MDVNNGNGATDEPDAGKQPLVTDEAIDESDNVEKVLSSRESPAGKASFPAAFTEDGLWDEKSIILPYSKQDHVRWCCECGDMAPGHEQRFAKDLAGTYYWSGNHCKDLLFFIRQWHPLFGLVCSHPRHPWTKLERFAAIVFSASGAVFILAVSRSEDIPWHQVFLKVSLPISFVDILLYYFFILDMYFMAYPRAVKVFAFMTRWAIWIIFIVAGLLFGATMWKTTFKVKALLEETAKSFAMQWVFWLPLHYFLPFIGFRWVWMNEKKATEDEKHKNGGEVQLQERNGKPGKGHPQDEAESLENGALHAW